MRGMLVLVLFALPAAVSAQAPAAAPLPAGITRIGTVEGVSQYKLANGLQILLVPDPSQPKVTVNATLFCGSRHEGYGETGMAHLLEHMVFKGCPKFPDVPKALRDHGADFNGTTWYDRTNYYETMPATEENLEFGIELEADRMANSFIKREDLMSEFTVVRNEFEAGENNPKGVLLERVMSAAYEWHNYGKSTIGNRTDIERVPIDNLQAFYKKYYRPDNAMLVVAGKFDDGKALALIAKHFGPLKPPADPLPKTYTEEPPQDGERLVTLRRIATTAVVGAAYHIPAAAHPDYPAVELLEDILTRAPSGRLYKALVEPKIASAVGGFAFNLHDPSLLITFADVSPEKAEQARTVLIETLEALTKTPITDEEVERSKQEGKQAYERTLANSQRFAVELSNWAGCGDWRLFFLNRDRLEKVTAADINRVAAAYLLRSNRTVGVFVPTKVAERASVPETPALAKLLDGYAGRAAMAAGEAFVPTAENVEKRVVRGTIGDSIKYAYLAKKTRGETVNLQLSLRYGTEASLKNQGTAASLIGPMLTRGTKTRTRQQIRDELAKLNATLALNSDTAGLIVVTVQTKSKNLPDVLTLVQDILRHPAFPDKEFEIIQRERVTALEEGLTDPQALAVNAFRRKLEPLPPDAPRYWPTIPESISKIKALTTAQLRELYTQQVGAQAGEVAVVGEFDPAAITPKLEALLKDWKSVTPYVRIVPGPPATIAGVETIVTPDKDNAIYIGGVITPVGDRDPDYAALEVGNYLLGSAPLASRLSNRVRGKDGLSYGVGSNLTGSPIDDRGMFMMFAITNPKNMAKVDAAIADEVNKFLKEGVSASELEEAKKAFVQSLATERANDGTLARQLAEGLFVKRSFAYYAELEKKIEALQPADVNKAFNARLDPKKLVIIQAGDLPKADAPKDAAKKDAPKKDESK